MKTNRIRITALVIVLAMATLSCGTTSSDVEVVSTAGADDQVTSPAGTTYNVGDVIKVSNLTITLNSAQIVGGLVQVNFTIENLGTEIVNVGPLVNFEAKDASGTKLELEIFDCPSGNMQSKIPAGDLLKGNICWKGLTTSTVRIYYTPNVFSGTIIVWDLE